MNSLIVLCNPEPKSLNAAAATSIAEAFRSAGHSTRLLDLYRIEFSPILTADEVNRRFSFDEIVQEHAHFVTTADSLVFVHPDWWGAMPALLKGWIDRVFRPGVAYEYEGPEFGTKSRVPLMSGKSASVCITSDQPLPPDGHPIERIWTEHILAFCGIIRPVCHILGDIRNTTYRRRRRWIREISRECVATADRTEFR